MALSDWRARTPAELREAIQAERATPAQRDLIARWVDETVANAAQADIDRLLARIARHPDTKLNDRDLDTLGYTAFGYTLKETADALYLVPQSVDARRRNLCRKLGARNVTHAVTLWLLREDS